MKIEIDTQRDSKDEIKKLIRMLQAMVGEASGWSSGSQENKGPDEMVNLGFLDDNTTTSSSQDSTLTETSEEKDEKPKIELY